MSKVVLAYSGGLDTSVILHHLKAQGHEVIAYIADVGQDDDFEVAANRAREIGAVDVCIEDLKRPFVTDYIFPAIAGNAIYENRYLLGTSLARPIIAERHVEVALKHGAEYLSHGATGKGNDQIRFEFAYAALAPKLKVIAPWKDKAFLTQFKGRSDLLAYAAEHNIPVEATAAKPYSMDENLLHISYEAGKLEDPNWTPTADMFRKTKAVEEAPNTPTRIRIQFKNGIPSRLEIIEHPQHDTNQSPTVLDTFTDPMDLFNQVNTLGGEHGIGRIDIVENRFVGIKSRGVYETPGGTILHAALRDLEGIAMDREVLHLRDMLAPKFAEIIYNGFWYSPEGDFLRAAFTQASKLIDGEVRLKLFKGNITVEGRTSSTSLYDEKLASMDVEGGYDQSDAAGFITINALRLRAHKLITRAADKSST